jgi:hypothetical protein
MPRCSKAPRGLFVLSRVTCIFTGIAISPSPLSRQCPSRYAFRAGRNLPDKEFRYLRTVIVTAAVYRGFSSELSTPPFNLPALGRRQPLYVRLRVQQRPVFLVNSRLGLVIATLTCTHTGMPRYKQGHPFFRRYGVNLPSSLTRVLSIALVFSTHLPVSVCGTGTGASSLRGFSRQCGLNDSTSPSGGLVPALPLDHGGFPSQVRLHRDTDHVHRPALIYPAASPHHSALVVTEYKPFVHRLRPAASA